jgi:outer membrane protein OmpA-like peptidoglycan-associated protein
MVPSFAHTFVSQVILISLLIKFTSPMKRLIFLFAIASIQAYSQSEPITITVLLTNEITGKPINATLEWYDPVSIKNESIGQYTLVLGGDKEETLTISKPGYFDTELKLDYETVKQAPVQEVKLQPGVPQLHISVTDAETGKTLDSSIDLFSLDESIEIFSEKVEVSPFTIDLEYNQVHVLQVRAPGYFSFKDTIDFKGVYEGRVREKKIKLVPLKAGNKISLNNIYFHQNEAGLTDFAKLMLVELTHLLEQEQKIKLEIGAYTDDVGTDQYNLDLSQKRALAVKNYLVEKGAKQEQLVTKGYGEKSPLAPNNSEQNRALNRRVEFKIITVK